MELPVPSLDYGRYLSSLGIAGRGSVELPVPSLDVAIFAVWALRALLSGPGAYALVVVE